MSRDPLPAAGPTIAVDVMVQSALWDDVPEAESIVRRALAAAAAETADSHAEIAILLTEDSAMRELNRHWRGQDKPTNVLSFPSSTAGRTAGHLGDIVIAYETLAREAATEGKPFAYHLAHLVIHGYLHLLGYDHMTNSEAEKMERLEAGLLRRLGIPDPYARSAPRG
jgi:probable rRNA maturation factor